MASIATESYSILTSPILSTANHSSIWHLFPSLKPWNQNNLVWIGPSDAKPRIQCISFADGWIWTHFCVRRKLHDGRSFHTFLDSQEKFLSTSTFLMIKWHIGMHIFRYAEKKVVYVKKKLFTGEFLIYGHFWGFKFISMTFHLIFWHCSSRPSTSIQS